MGVDHHGDRPSERDHQEQRKPRESSDAGSPRGYDDWHRRRFASSQAAERAVTAREIHVSWGESRRETRLSAIVIVGGSSAMVGWVSVAETLGTNGRWFRASGSDESVPRMPS
jgi:hypothetical protein